MFVPPMTLINQQESAQPMNRTLPTSFRGSRRLQQPKPLSTPPLSASTATHNTNLYGTIGFLGRQSIAIQNRFVEARASLVEEESGGEDASLVEEESGGEETTEGRTRKWRGRKDGRSKKKVEGKKRRKVEEESGGEETTEGRRRKCRGRNEGTCE